MVFMVGFLSAGSGEIQTTQVYNILPDKAFFFN